MIASKGYYAAIQLCPDPSRLETVNVGALLYCPERHFLKAEFAADFRRARKLFGRLDEAFLQMQKQTIVDRLLRVEDFAKLEDLQHFMDTRAGALQFSPVRPMQVGQPEEELSRLFERLVEQETPARPRSRSRARTLFAKALEKEGLIEQVRQSIAVELPRIGKVLKANYGYKNGRFNVIEPVDFTSASGWFKTASARAIEGRELQAVDDPGLGRMNLVVVGRFASGTEQHGRAVRQILSDHDVVLHEIDRLGPLLADMRAHIGH